jgi:hypothetical protein
MAQGDYEAWRIDLPGCRIEDKQLDKLRVPAPIVGLILTDCPITDLGVPHLASLTSLEVPELTNTRISDRSLPVLPIISPSQPALRFKTHSLAILARVVSASMAMSLIERPDSKLSNRRLRRNSGCTLN